MKKILLSCLFILAILNTNKAQTKISICAGSNEYYKVKKTEGSVYHWTLKCNGGNIQTFTETDSVKIQWKNTTGIDTLTVIETNKYNCKGIPQKLIVKRISKPTGYFVDEYDTLCNNDGVELKVVLQGTPPWDIKYDDGSNTYEEKNIATSPHYIPVTTENSGEYIFSLTEIKSGKCSSQMNNSRIIFDVSPPVNTSPIIFEE